MAFVTVYDLVGTAHEKEPVDARECVNVMGWSMDAPEQGEVSREGMKAFLVEKGVTFPANIKGPALSELYEAEKAKG